MNLSVDHDGIPSFLSYLSTIAAAYPSVFRVLVASSLLLQYWHSQRWRRGIDEDSADMFDVEGRARANIQYEIIYIFLLWERATKNFQEFPPSSLSLTMMTKYRQYLIFLLFSHSISSIQEFRDIYFSWHFSRLREVVSKSCRIDCKRLRFSFMEIRTIAQK